MSCINLLVGKTSRFFEKRTALIWRLSLCLISFPTPARASSSPAPTETASWPLLKASGCSVLQMPFCPWGSSRRVTATRCQSPPQAVNRRGPTPRTRVPPNSRQRGRVRRWQWHHGSAASTARPTTMELSPPGAQSSCVPAPAGSWRGRGGPAAAARGGEAAAMPVSCLRAAAGPFRGAETGSRARPRLTPALGPPGRGGGLRLTGATPLPRPPGRGEAERGAAAPASPANAGTPPAAGSAREGSGRPRRPQPWRGGRL